MPRRSLNRRRNLREAYAAQAGELYGLAVRSLGDPGLAEEAVQETFLRAWRAGDRFDDELESLRRRLFANLRDVVIDLGRDRSGDVAEATVEQSLLGRQVEEALRRVDQVDRQILVDAYYRGRPYTQIATELDVPEQAVKGRLSDALQALKVALEEVGIQS
ncbi:MAG: sigma-70 family RNA polymerase sigma factor [Actinobacteria bacterium]|nr:sigma-70 family RNA polymerase sigma factor [Actinomycetota bacterium]